MKKHEFLRELENSLKGKLSEIDINEILSDYDDIFEDAMLEDRAEDEISESIGSPAAISKAIVDESINNTVKQSMPPITKDISNLAPMSKRFLAYLIDTVFIVIVFIVIIVAISSSKTYDSGTYTDRVIILKNSGIGLFEWAVQISNLLVLMGIGFTNIITGFELWLFKGYTLGKWITKIRVVKLNGDTITFWDAFLRDILLKFGASLCVFGMVNLVSFIMGSVTPDHKTVHDFAAKTKVINIKR